MKDPSPRVVKELDHVRVLDRVYRHRLGFFYNAVNQRHPAFELDAFDRALVLVVFLSRHRHPRIGRQVLATARLRRREEIEVQVVAGKKHRGHPRDIAGRGRQRHRVAGPEIVEDLLL